MSDLPGSAGVLISRIQPKKLDLHAGGLDRLLWWLLRGDFTKSLRATGNERYRESISRLTHYIKLYFDLSADADRVSQVAANLRRTAYSEGTARELLLADACCAMVSLRISNSARSSLPGYSGMSLSVWEPALRKASFFRELWPAQHILGQRKVFSGASAVVQMPTSAGKSRATELIIRSAFLSGRASLAIIVGPFRALCHEIRESLMHSFRGENVIINLLSDVLQFDFRIDEIDAAHAIIVMTPEKLVYVLRYLPEITSRIGLLVLDEGHQFDSGARGVTYELLVTMLKEMIPAAVQKVLISAVISNSTDLGRWLNGNEGVVIAGPALLPTERSVAFTSWNTQFGQLHFVMPDNPDEEEFFVPGVIRSSVLNLRPGEKKKKLFPAKGDSRSVALYLGLRLIRNGAVAIFCSRKDTASSLCEALVDAVARGLELPTPIEYSDTGETRRIAYMYQRNLGISASTVLAAQIGAFTHHGNTPHGVRLAVEFAIKEGLGKFVFCTTTLAQGVNLPIRYLVVIVPRQGGEKIKVRDFHNLMGRAGRSGMHTEGSVIFADPEVYDTRAGADSKWPEFKALLQARNSEPCASTLLSLLGPLRSDGGAIELDIDPWDVVSAYLRDETGTGAWMDEMARQLTRRWFSAKTLRRQLVDRYNILAAIESFLLAHWNADGSGVGEGEYSARSAGDFAKRTLAYHLASFEQRKQMIALFDILSKNVVARVPNPEGRRICGRTLFGVGEALEIENWVFENCEQISACEDDDDMFGIIWPCIERHVANSTFRKWIPSETRIAFARGWIAGVSFGELHERMLGDGARIGLGVKPRKPSVEQVVEMGENALGFDGAHVLGAITEFFEFSCPGNDDVVAVLQRLQKRLKYGLPSTVSILLFEVGFADRPLAIDLAKVVPEISSRTEIKAALLRDQQSAAGILSNYPQYFHLVFKRVIG